MRAQLATPAGKPLSFNADDVLWLSRAVEAEGEPRDLVAQTLVNRWAWLRDVSPGRFPRLQDLVRAYAQPVNPAWYPDGAKHAAAVTKSPEQAAELERRAEARRDLHSTRTTFSARTLAAVRQALHGPITLPAGGLHYAAAWVERPDLPLLVQGVPGQSNSIWGESGGRGVGALYAFQVPGPQFAQAAVLGERPHAVLAFLFLAGGAVLGLTGLRRRKK